MTGDEPRAAKPEEAAEAADLREAAEMTAGGDPACWAGLVCQECGAVISEGHRSGCSQAEQPVLGGPEDIAPVHRFGGPPEG